jgi:hypothetical protein
MRLILLAALAVIAIACPSLAQTSTPVAAVPDTVVGIPYGNWIGDAFAIWGAAIASYIVFAVRGMFAAFGPRVNAILLTMQADQLLNRALVYAMNAVVGASKDKVWSVDVRNQVLKEVVTFALVHGSDAVKSFMGKPEAIAEMGFSRIDAPTADPASKLTVLPDAPKPDFVQIGAQAAVAANTKGVPMP